MVSYEELGHLLLIPEFIIPKTKIQQAEIQTLAAEIIQSGKKNGRTEDQIFKSCEGIVVERWVEENSTFILNDIPFDHDDPESYAFDLIEPTTKQTLEVKTSGITPNSRWWSFYNMNHVNTMLNNLHRISFIFVAALKRETDLYIITPRLLLKSEHVNRARIAKSAYGNCEAYFNHTPIKDQILYTGNIA